LLCAGAAVALGSQLRQVLALHRLGKEATPLEGSDWSILLEEARARMGVRRRVRLLLHTKIPVPMTWGFFRPAIAMPARAESWDRDRRVAVLLHELAHVRRGDWPALVLARLARALYWANPLAWWATARLAQAQELACDRLVVARGLLPSDYARHLVHIARDARVFPAARAGLAVARSSDVEVRVMSILKPSTQSSARRFLGTGAALLLSLLLLATTAALAMLQPAPRVAAVAAYTVSRATATAAVVPAQQPATVRAPAEDGGEPGDLASLAEELGKLERRLRPFEEEMRDTEARLRPFEEQLRAIELEARGHEELLREAERGMEARSSGLENELETALAPHERRLREIEQAMRPIEQRMRETERELRPLERAIEEQARALEVQARQLERSGDLDDASARELERQLDELHEQLEPIHERLGALHAELEPHLAEMELVHEQMEPVHERMEALHRDMEPFRDRMEELHRQLEPFHERMEQVHELMEPVHAEMERIHERMEPLHREMEALHQRVERALHGEVRVVLQRELGGVPEKAVEAAADRVAGILDLQVRNGWLRVRGSAPALREEIARALRENGATAGDDRIAAAADAILELQTRIPTGRE
jgi:uncharacterized coiled-coil DUF342 family protein